MNLTNETKYSDFEKAGKSEVDYKNVFDLISQRRPVTEIALLTGASEIAVRGLIKIARGILEADAGEAHRLIALVDRWDETTGQDAFFDPNKLHRDLLNFIERRLESHEIRKIAASLLKLADARDQNWSGTNSRSVFNWRSEARRIESNAIPLAKRAVRLLKQKDARKEHIPPELLGEPAWYMLLELFCQFAGGARISSKSLCIAADCPITTALRYIDRLEEDGFVIRTRSANDGRVTLVELTEKGVVRVGGLLDRVYY
jgi:DNA-binding MarR family transcriptional regulator